MASLISTSLFFLWYKLNLAAFPDAHLQAGVITIQTSKGIY